MNENIVHLNYLDKDIYLVKTAHVSKSSIEDVNNTVEEVNPDSICVELDQERYDRFVNKSNWQDTDIKTVIKEKKVGLLLVNMILASFQRRMAEEIKSQSGGEMIRGIEISEERNIPLVLADRNINTTFTRIWNSLGFIEKCKLLATIIYSIFDDETISEEDLEELKQSDMLDAALSEIGKQFPNVKRILVDERDMYLATKIKNAPGNKVVAIVGAAHASGIERHLNDEIDLKEIEDTSKKKSYVGTIIKWAIPIIFILMIIYTLFTSVDTGLNQIKAWFLFCGIGSALGSLLGLAHPITIVVSFIVAPFTALNPLLAAGWFAGLTELWIRKPKVQDFTRLSEDTNSLKGFYKNRVTRTLLIVVLCNVFCSIGSIIGGIDVVRSFLGIL